MTTLDRWVRARDEIARETFVIDGENEVGAVVSEATAQMKSGMSAIDGMSAEAQVGLETAEYLAEYRKIEAKQKELARMRADPKVGLDDDQFNRAAAALEAKKKLLEKKIEIPVDMDRSTLQAGATALRKFGGEVDDNHGKLGRWLSSLGKVRLQMGFLSGTVRQAAIGFTILGPVVFGLIGSLSSLVGVLGTGLTGALTVSGAAVTGFGLVAAGLLPSIKQLFTELKTAPSVVGPLQRMRDTLTGDIRQNFFRDAHQAVQTLQADFPMFRTQATAAFAAASQGWQEWMRGLRSPEAQQILSTIIRNFTAGLPALMQGFGTIGSALGRVLASASKSLPALNQGFAQWANNLAKSIGSGNALDQKIGRLVGHMQDVGHFAQASGRLLVNFFNAGANTGDSLLRSITASFNQWNAWMNSVAGQTSLQAFFQRSADLARQLGPAIARIGTSLANLSTAAEPLSEGLATGLNVLAGIAAALPPPLLQAAGAFYVLNKAVTAFTTGKLVAMLSGVVTWVRSLFVSEAAETAALAGNTAAQEANAVVRGEVAAAATAEAAAVEAEAVAQAASARAGGASAASWARTAGATTAAGTAAGAAAPEIAAVGTAAEGAAASSATLFGPAALGGAGLVFAATVVGATILSNKMDEMSDSTKAAVERFQHQNTLVKQLPTTYAAWRASIQATKQAQDSYSQSLKQNGARSHETAIAAKALNQAIKQQNAELASLRSRGLASYNQGISESQRSTANWQRYLSQTDPGLTNLAGNLAEASGRGAEFSAALQRNGTSALGVARSLQQVGLSVRQLGVQNLPVLQNQLQQFNATQQRSAAGVVNYIRSLRGMAPVTGAAAQAVGKFIQQFGQVKGAKNAVIRTNAPQEAGKVARLATQLQQLGQRKAVVRILGEGGNADAVIGKLQKKVDGVNQKKGVAKLSAQDQASGKVAGAKAKLDGFAKKYDAVMHTLGADAAAQAAHTATDAVNAFPVGTRTATLNTVYNTFGHKPGGYAGGVFPGSIPGFAQGRPDTTLNSAHASAQTRQSRAGEKGAKVTRPTYITGEENRPEYVIATNPSYRDANLGYLAMAASDLGATMFIPAHKKGHPGRKGSPPAKPSEANPSPLLNAWNAATADQQFWADEFDLDKRTFESHIGGGGTVGGAALNDLLADLGFSSSLQATGGGEYGAYVRMLGLLGPVQALRKNPLQKDLKNTKSKKAKKKQKQITSANAATQSRNEQIDEANSDIQSFSAGTLGHLMQGLFLDAQELVYGAQNAQNASQEQTNTLRQQLYNQFASNVAGGFTGPNLTGAGLSSATSFPSLGSGVPGAAGGMGASLRTASPVAAAAQTTGGSTIVINNSFPTPPPDPHTFVQGVTFEIQAASP